MELIHALTKEHTFLKGGGEMGQLTRQFDWASTSLGSPDNWPQSLRTTLGIILHSKFPMFLWWGPELLCFYNDAYRPSLGINGKHPYILGQPAPLAWAEIWPDIGPRIEQVLSGGDAIYHEDLLVPIYRNGKIEDVYWTFGYSPVIDESGIIGGVLVTCHETTHQVKTFKTLQLSERRFYNLIQDISIGIVVLIGEELKIEVTNNAYGKLLCRRVEEVINRPLFSIIPEAEAEFRPIIDNVRTTGNPFYQFEHPYTVYNNEKIISGYLNVSYQPYAGEHSQSNSVIIICHDVTEEILARKKIETALEQLRLSKEAAQLGMFDMDLEKGTLIWDKRCRILFGISHDQEVSYEHDFVNGLHPDDRLRITKIIDNLFIRSISNGDYDVEYRTIGAEDKRLRWVRAKGKVYFDNETAVRFIGSVLDITDAKIEEARKNDFIAMVSHELKTPLTSITGYLQILMRNADEGNNALESSLLARTNLQTKKMISLINSFLNLSRFELGRPDLQFGEFVLNDLIKVCVDDVKIGYPNLSIEVVLCAPIHIVADREKIGAVITNFLTNAAKYSKNGNAITIACVQTDDDVSVSVRDTGMGISKEDLPFIFDRFYRIVNEKTREISGFGIGLYLSSEIIKFHGGRIWAESEYGVGSVFNFSIPTQPACPRATQLSPG